MYKVYLPYGHIKFERGEKVTVELRGLGGSKGVGYTTGGKNETSTKDGVPYPFGMYKKMDATVVGDYPNFVVLTIDSRPSFFGMSIPYNITIDKVWLVTGSAIIKRRSHGGIHIA